jgi:nucleoside-diphosphate-sugar epimerase
MQTILGAGGVIGRELAASLPSYTDRIRLVSRNPKKVNPNDELFPADLLNPEHVRKAVEGSSVVYLTAGLAYNIKIWRAQWPVVMDNVINACREAGAPLVFIDNIYSLGKVDGWMTEESLLNPCSEKGKVRTALNRKLLDAMQAGKLRLIIARAPDFYGPDALSFVNAMIFDNLKKGKTPQLLVNADRKHSLIYTPDAGKAMALLGNTGNAFNQVWNLPTAKPPLTSREIVSIAAKALGKPDKFTVLSKFMMRIVGLFVPVIGESVEMLYQNEFDYLFDSTKFEKAFSFIPTPYEEGIVKTLDVTR